MDWEESKIQGSLEKPKRRDDNNGAGASHKDEAPVKPSVTHQIGQRQEGYDDRDLPNFYTQVEACEGQCQGPFRQQKIREDTCKTKAMDEAEAEGHGPTPAVNDGLEIIEGREHN